MLLVGKREGVWNADFRVDDEGAVDSCPEPVDMGMPEKGALLLNQSELIGERLPGLNGALCDVRRAVEPARQPLSNAMPAPKWVSRR